MSGFCCFVTWCFSRQLFVGHRVLDKQINELEDNANYYIQEIKKDQKNIKQLKNPR
jgi:ribosomal protein S6